MQYICIISSCETFYQNLSSFRETQSFNNGRNFICPILHIIWKCRAGILNNPWLECQYPFSLNLYLKVWTCHSLRHWNFWDWKLFLELKSTIPQQHRKVLHFTMQIIFSLETFFFKNHWIGDVFPHSFSTLIFLSCWK